MGTRRVVKAPLLSRVSFGGAPYPFPFASDGVTFWHRGQTALWQGVQALRLGRGARALMPAYNCGSEVDVLLKAGLDIDFYRLNDDLSPNLDHLSELCQRSAGLVYVIHYFGMAQPMDELIALANEYGQRLIEDNAPGLYSLDDRGVPLGSFGDISVFSIRKTLPIPDGGALFVKKSVRDSNISAEAAPPSRALITKTLSRMLIQEFLHRLPRWAYDRLGGQGGADTIESGDVDDLQFPVGIRAWKMSAFSRYVAERADHAQIRDRRRRNYNILDDLCQARQELRPIFDGLRRGSCPLFYPIWVADPAEFTRHVYRCGGWCAPYWHTVHPILSGQSFPFEAGLRQHIRVLPVHQDLEEHDMIRIADILNDWMPH